MNQARIPGFIERHKMKQSNKYGYLCFFLFLVMVLGTAQENEVNRTAFESSHLTSGSSLMYQTSFDNQSGPDVIYTSLEKDYDKLILTNNSVRFPGFSLYDDLESNSFQVTTAPQWDLIELSISNDSCIDSQLFDMCDNEFLSQDDVCSAIRALYFLGDHPVEGNVFMALVVGVKNLRHIGISQRGETKKVTLCSNNPKKKSVLYFVFAFYKDESLVLDVDKELKINHAEEFIEYLIPLPVECRTILLTSMLVRYMAPSYIFEIDVTSSVEYRELCLPALSQRSNLTTLSSGNTFYVSSLCYIFISDVDFIETEFCDISLRNPHTNEEVNACVDTSTSSMSFFYHDLIRYNYYFLWYDSNNEFCKIWSKDLPKGPAGSKVLRDKERIWMWIYEKPKNRTLLAEVNRMSTAIILHVHNMSSCIVALEKAFVFDEAYKHLREVTETYFLSVYDSEINQLCLDEARNLTNQILHGNRRVDFTENFPLASFSTEENYYLFELSTWDESFYIIFAKNCSNVKRSQAHYLITGIHCNDELDWNFFCRSDIYLSWQLKLSRHIDFTSLCSSTSSQVDAMIKDLEKLPGNWVWTYVDHLCGSEIWNICKDVYNNKELGKLLGSQWSLASQYVDYFSMTCINYRITENPVVLFLNKKVKCHNRTEEDQKFILGTFDPKDKNYELTRPKTIQTNMNNRDWVSEITISSIPNKCPLFSWESNDKQFLIDILTGSIFENDTACMEHICTGSLQSSCIYERCSPIRFGPLEKSLYTISCFKYLPGSLWWDINEGFMFNRTTINWFWAIESYNYLIVYDNPEEKVVSLDWDYLSKKAMVWEAFLVSITVFVTSSLIFGNFLVIFVMVTGGHRGEISGILRNSLAVSDFLTGLFPCSLAVSDAVCLMTGRLTLYDLDAKSVLSSFERLVSDVLPPGLTELKFERFGYPAFCSLVFAVSSTSSLLTHFSLAIERYRAVSAAAVRGTVFNTPKKKAVAVMVPWLTAIAFAVICGSGNGSFLIGYLDPITKLTLWLPTSGTLVVSTVFFWLQFVAVAIFILATLIGTLLSVKTFTEERKREMKESQAYYEPSEEEVIQNKTILRRGRTTLLLTATLLGGSVLPMAASSFWQFPRYLPIFHYLMWWLFIAGMSCNWIVYNMRSKLFYSDMAESLLLLKAILPARMIRILENRVTDPRHPPPISEEDQIDLYRCVFRTTEDEKSTSKKRKEERTGDEDLEEVSNGSLNDRKDRGNTNVRSKSVKEPTQETAGVDNLNFLNNDSAIIEKGNIEFQEKESVVSPESLTTVEKGNGENDCQHLQDKKEA